MVKRIDKLKKLVAEFEALQKRYKHTGADDTEPDAQFQLRLVQFFQGNSELPARRDWELYSGHKKHDEVADILTAKLKEIRTVIHGSTDSSHEVIKTYLEDYVWRVDW